MANPITDAAKAAAAGGTAGSVVPGVGTAIGAGVGLVGSLAMSLMAYLGEREAYEAAQNIINEAQSRFGSIDDSAIQEAAKAVLPPSMLGAISTAPEYDSAMREALAGLKNVSDNGGLALADRAVQEDALTRSAQADRSRRGALTDRFQRQGTGGSYAELAAQLQSQQSTANRDAQIGLSAAGMAQQRALDALRQRGTMGAQFQGQQWGQKAQAASAQDSINRFNVSRQDALAQQQWQNQFNQANAQAQLAASQANGAQNAGVSRAQTIAGVGNQIGRTATELGGYYDRAYGDEKPTGTASEPTTGSDDSGSDVYDDDWS